MIEIENEATEAVKEVEISYLRIDTGERECKRDLVTVEMPLHLIVNEEHYVTILSTPTQKRELAIGHLITEGVVKDLNEIREIKIDEQKCFITLRPDVKVKERFAIATPFRRVVTSACSTPEEWPLYRLVDRLKIPRVRSKLRVDAKIIAEAVRGFSTEATIHAKTGGVHAAAVHNPSGKRVAFSEDVGRHNAVDKAIGMALIKNHSLERSFLVSTGRLTGDIALKAARVAIPIVASLAAAVDSGIEVANLTCLTLIGFVRGNRMNIYTHPERVI